MAAILPILANSSGFQFHSKIKENTDSVLETELSHFGVALENALFKRCDEREVLDLAERKLLKILN